MDVTIGGVKMMLKRTRWDLINRLCMRAAITAGNEWCGVWGVEVESTEELQRRARPVCFRIKTSHSSIRASDRSVKCSSLSDGRK